MLVETAVGVLRLFDGLGATHGLVLEVGRRRVCRVEIPCGGASLEVRNVPVDKTASSFSSTP